MNCREASKLIHSLLDEELSTELKSRVEKHLSSCENCGRLRVELELVKNLISRPRPLSAASSRQLWADLERRRSRNLFAILREWLDSTASLFSEWEKQTLWARLSALPLTAIGFLLLAAQFPRVPTQEMTYPVFLVPAAAVATTSSGSSRPVMMQARQGRRELHDLIETVWRIPYEDSLSFVAEIQPGGHATIGDILEHPRNEKLLDAAAASLNDLRFDPSADFKNSFLIYSIQKVDVYEGRGL